MENDRWNVADFSLSLEYVVYHQLQTRSGEVGGEPKNKNKWLYLILSEADTESVGHIGEFLGREGGG